MTDRAQSLKPDINKKNYKELADERKQKQIQNIWNNVEAAPELAVL